MLTLSLDEVTSRRLSNHIPQQCGRKAASRRPSSKAGATGRRPAWAAPVSSGYRYLRVFAIGQLGRGSGSGGGVKQPPDPSGEMAFQTADGFQSGLALCVFAVEVDAGLGVSPRAGQRDDVQGAVELPVAAAV
jgi:hypothetical protein